MTTIRTRLLPTVSLLLVALMVLLLPGTVTHAFPAPKPFPALENHSFRKTEGVPRPPIVQKRIPFGERRRREMAAYSKRHYGRWQWRLKDPKVIVQHYSVTPTLSGLFNTFETDRPDPEFNELPNVCAHFGVARSGRVFQFVSLDRRCRHTVGLNQVSIGIEHVGYSDHQVLSNRKQMRGSLRLTRWLRCRYGIKVENVIGHNESLRSPYHREKVKRLRHVTHGDFKRKAMRRYRKRLRQSGRCPRPSRP